MPDVQRWSRVLVTRGHASKCSDRLRRKADFSPQGYLINQDYAYGQAVRRAAKEMLAVNARTFRSWGTIWCRLAK